jgi:hypothetical protein
MKKTIAFIAIAPLAIAAMMLQAWRLRDLDYPKNHEMWE